MPLVASLVPILFGVTPAAGYHVSEIPPKVLVLIDRALSVSFDQCIRLDPYLERTLDSQFREALDGLAEVVDDKTLDWVSPYRGIMVSTTMVDMALDRKQHPESYAEIEREYLEQVDRMFHVPRAPALQELHAQPEYRLVWEFALLKPVNTGRIPGVGVTEAAYSAVAKIGNPASLATLLHIHRVGWAVLGYGPGANYKLWETIGTFATAKGLRTILAFISHARHDAIMERRYFAWNPEVERRVIEVIAGKYGNADKWRKLLADFKEHLAADEQRLLDEARRLAAGPTTAAN
jgi:hypothetical protein